jgi:hypothetical protein
MTTRGGKRDGSGRPQGATNKLSRAAIQRAMARGEEMPLDFMLKYMRGEPVEQKVTVNGKEKRIRKPLPIEARLKLAEACAPYLHQQRGLPATTDALRLRRYLAAMDRRTQGRERRAQTLCVPNDGIE